jgi:hypothetical protein
MHGAPDLIGRLALTCSTTRKQPASLPRCPRPAHRRRLCVSACRQLHRCRLGIREHKREEARGGRTEVLKYKHIWEPTCKVAGGGMGFHNLNVAAQSNGPYPTFSDFQYIVYLHQIRSPTSLLYKCLQIYLHGKMKSLEGMNNHIN